MIDVFGDFGIENFHVMSKFYIIPDSNCVVFPLRDCEARQSGCEACISHHHAGKPSLPLCIQVTDPRAPTVHRFEAWKIWGRGKQDLVVLRKIFNIV